MSVDITFQPKTQPLDDGIAAVLGSSALGRGVVIDAESQAILTPAPNTIEWCVGKDWCNQPKLYEYSGSYQVIRDFFALRCPVCNPKGNGVLGSGAPDDCWKKPRSWLESEVLLTWNASISEDACPKCGVARSEFVENKLLRDHSTLVAVIGQRAGKSIFAALIATYMEHRVVIAGHTTPGGLSEYFGGLARGDLFEMTLVASTDTQSQDTIWAKYVGMRGESPWYQRYVPWLKMQENNQAIRMGMKPWRYVENDREVRNEHPNVKLLCRSVNSNAPGLRGRTRVGAFADEISHMLQTDSTHSATEILRALENSLTTVRTRVKTYGCLSWLGALVAVTSPASRDDKGMELLAASKKVPSMMGVHHATWEFNPFQPREAFAEKYLADPIGAERDFGANPPGASSPLIRDERRWWSLAVDPGLVSHFQFDTYRREDAGGHRYIAARLRRAHTIHDGRPRYIVADAGATWDAFALACAHGERNDAGQLQTVFDWVIRILPGDGEEVYFDCVKDIVKGLMPHMHIQVVEFDHWSSTQVIQQCRDVGVLYAEQRALTNQDWIDWEAACFAGLVRMLPPRDGEFGPGGELLVEPPQLSASGAAIYELTRLERDASTDKVTNPRKGRRKGFDSNDCAQVIVHAHKLVQMERYVQRPDDHSTRARRHRMGAGGDVNNIGSLAGGVGHGAMAINGVPMVGVTQGSPDGSRGRIHYSRGSKRGW